MICAANQLTGFCTRATLAFNGLMEIGFPGYKFFVKTYEPCISMFFFSEKIDEKVSLFLKCSDLEGTERVILILFWKSQKLIDDDNDDNFDDESFLWNSWPMKVLSSWVHCQSFSSSQICCATKISTIPLCHKTRTTGVHYKVIHT